MIIRGEGVLFYRHSMTIEAIKRVRGNSVSAKNSVGDKDTWTCSYCTGDKVENSFDNIGEEDRNYPDHTDNFKGNSYSFRLDVLENLTRNLLVYNLVHQRRLRQILWFN
jgi:hypothetical protein